MISTTVRVKRNDQHVTPQNANQPELTVKQRKEARLADKDFAPQCERFLARTGFLFDNLIVPVGDSTEIEEEMQLLEKYQQMKKKILEM